MSESKPSVQLQAPTPVSAPSVGIRPAAGPPRGARPAIKARLDEIIKATRVNLERLVRCPGHRLVARVIENKRVTEWQCSVCTGILTPDQAFWYKQGTRRGLLPEEIEGLIRLLKSADQNTFNRNIALKLQQMAADLHTGALDQVAPGVPDEPLK
jgi:hypothetical protein